MSEMKTAPDGVINGGGSLTKETPEKVSEPIVPEPDQGVKDESESVDELQPVASKPSLPPQGSGIIPPDTSRFRPPPEPYLKNYPRTDAGNAERLRALFGKNILYVDAWKSWVIWDDTRWRKDDLLLINQMAPYDDSRDAAQYSGLLQSR